MELNDAVRRVLGQHRWLILGCVAIGICAALLLHLGDKQTYTAQTRFSLDAEDPETQSESAAIADTAKAIATSPLQVRRAIADAEVTGRDAVEVARHVSIRALGTSGVLQLSVSDARPRPAAAIANALTGRVISTRLTVKDGQLQQVTGDLTRRIDALNSKLGGLDAEIEALGGSPAAADSADPAASSRLRDLLRQRDALTQQRSVLESERVRALSTDALRPTPSIISPASVPREPDSSRRLPDMVLGGLLGLIFGVGLAALIESLRPTLVGSDALAREFDTPLIGALPRSDGANDRLEDVIAVAARLRLAAKAAGVRNIGLLPTRRDLDLESLAARLDAASAAAPALASVVGSGAGPRAEAVPDGPTFRIRPFDIRDSAMSSNRGGTGLVLVSPTTLKKTELDEIKHLLRMSPGPLVGLLTYTPAHDHQTAIGDDHAFVPDEHILDRDDHTSLRYDHTFDPHGHSSLRDNHISDPDDTFFPDDDTADPDDPTFLPDKHTFDADDHPIKPYDRSN
jgi:capsular polysaccharide biosynthesis protein